MYKCANYIYKSTNVLLVEKENPFRLDEFSSNFFRNHPRQTLSLALSRWIEAKITFLFSSQSIIIDYSIKDRIYVQMQFKEPVCSKDKFIVQWGDLKIEGEREGKKERTC